MGYHSQIRPVVIVVVAVAVPVRIAQDRRDDFLCGPRVVPRIVPLHRSPPRRGNQTPNLNTAICVGGPSAASSSPIPPNVTRYPCRLATPSAHERNSARVHSNRWSRCRSFPLG